MPVLDATTESRWARGHYRPGGGDATLYYAVYGAFEMPLDVSREKYRCDGVPAGVNVAHLTRDEQKDDFGKLLTGQFGKLLDKQRDKSTAKRVRKSSECLVLAGQIDDPPDLQYLRNTVGLIAYLFDNGAEAVCDVQSLRWFDRDTWRTYLFLPAAPLPLNHVSLIEEADAQRGAPRGSRWFHTRGMRKFGRPDISVRRVPSHFEETIRAMCHTLIESMAFGIQVPEGYEVAALPPGVTCHHAGSMDDPEFNNVHIDVRLPE